MKRSGVCAVLVALLFASACAAQIPLRVSSEEAAKHLTRNVDPVYPQMARLAHVQGQVTLDLTISEAGKVQQVTVISGHPILLQAAIEAAREWQYHPFEINGKPAAVRAVAFVFFLLGPLTKEGAREQALLRNYFDRGAFCKDQLNGSNYPEAEVSCKKLADIADQLPDTDVWEKVQAYRSAGDAFLGESNPGGALVFYQRELELAHRKLRPIDADMAYAWRDVARAQAVTGKLKESDYSYQQVEILLPLAQKNAPSKIVQREESKELRDILLEHASLLRKMGRADEAADLENRAHSIQVPQGPENETKH